MINEKVKRKPVPTLRYTAEMASEWFDPQAKKKMNYDDMRAGNLQMKRTSFRFLVLSISLRRSLREVEIEVEIEK